MPPDSFSTLVEMLATRARYTPEKSAVFFTQDRLSYAALWDGIKNFGTHLLNLGVTSGERILIVLPNSFEFFYAFYGAQLIKGVAVPIFPFSGTQRILNISRVCGAKVIVLPSHFPEKQKKALKTITNENQIILTSISESTKSNQILQPNKFPSISSDDVAFLQYTSGSTGNPKGVILTHDNLLTNIQQMIIGMEITEEDRFVSWLPVYHDMGLILKTMVPFFLGLEVNLLPTNLRDVGVWLQTIKEIKATFTAAPDFAYRLCLRHLEPDEYDLTSLRVALNAAEPVRAKTIERFHSKFNLNDIMVAGYGLAEATVGVSMWKPNTDNKVDHRGFVSVGKPFPDIQIKILNQGRELPQGEIGEIAIKSLANSTGYFQNPEATEAAFLDNGFFLSGDLGYLDNEGYLYIVGRKKNIIKRVGATISPQEIEEIIDSFSHIRYSAAIGIDRGGVEGEQVFVFAEIRGSEKLKKENLHHLAVNIVDHFYQEIGFRPARVYLLKPKTIPMTHNGKIQHTRLKSLYTNGLLRETDAILYPEF